MKYDDNKVRERIMKLMNMEGLQQIDFAAKIGRSQPSVSEIMSGKRKITTKFISDILDSFMEINKSWLVFGEGKMYESDVNLESAEELKRHMEKLPTRPRIPKNMSEGHLEDYYNGEKRGLCQEKPRVAQFPDYDFSLILKNDRMSPKYNRGDELYFKLANFPEWGNDFLLDTDDGPKFKRIFEATDKDGREMVRCASYNKDEYPDFMIPRDMIHNFYRCVGVLKIL